MINYISLKEWLLNAGYKVVYDFQYEKVKEVNQNNYIININLSNNRISFTKNDKQIQYTKIIPENSNINYFISSIINYEDLCR